MRLALAGDVMLGRGVAEWLAAARTPPPFSAEVIEAARSADLCVANLECCIAAGGRPAPGRVFHFRAPPAAAGVLAELGVDCVTLANNHALDYGPDALLETFDHLRAVGIPWVGAGADRDAARAPTVLEAGGERLRVLAVSDHPPEYAARADRPGVAFADLHRRALPAWLTDAIAAASEPVLVAPHWGPNMTRAPVRHVRRAAASLRAAGAALVAGHSAHVPHGAAAGVLFDLGDFVDDYRVDPVLRNDLGALWLVDLEHGAPVRAEALPLKLDFCHTRLADGDDAAWIAERLVSASVDLGARAWLDAGRVVIELGG